VFVWVKVLKREKKKIGGGGSHTIRNKVRGGLEAFDNWGCLGYPVLKDHKKRGGGFAKISMLKNEQSGHR